MKRQDLEQALTLSKHLQVFESLLNDCHLGNLRINGIDAGNLPPVESVIKDAFTDVIRKMKVELVALGVDIEPYQALNLHTKRYGKE